MSFSGCPSAKLPLPPVCPVSVELVAYPFPSASAIAAYAIVPAHPPLPTAWNLPFQPDAGSHTSILISESGDGVSVAATRQNPGSAFIASLCVPRPAPGVVNAPAATVCASVTLPASSDNVDSSSHVRAGDA